MPLLVVERERATGKRINRKRPVGRSDDAAQNVVSVLADVYSSVGSHRQPVWIGECSRESPRVSSIIVTGQARAHRAGVAQGTTSSNRANLTRAVYRSDGIIELVG